MSIVRVSELPSGSYIQSDDLLYISQNDGSGLASKKITLQQVQESFAYSIIRHDVNVYLGDTYEIGNQNGGTFKALYLGGTGLHLGYYDGQVGNWSEVNLSYDRNYNGLAITNLTPGNLTDSVMVINPTTNIVGYIPPTIRTTYGLFSQTGNSITVSGTTTESSIVGPGVGTLSIPANGFTVGDSFKALMAGVLSAQNNDTIRIRVKADTGMLLLDSGVQSLSNVTNNVFTLDLNFTIRAIGGAGSASIVSVGRFSYNKTVNGNIEGFAFNTVNNTTFNTTANTTLTITVQFGSNSANNIIYSDIFSLSKTY